MRRKRNARFDSWVRRKNTATQAVAEGELCHRRFCFYALRQQKQTSRPWGCVELGQMQSGALHLQQNSRVAASLKSCRGPRRIRKLSPCSAKQREGRYFRATSSLKQKPTESQQGDSKTLFRCGSTTKLHWSRMPTPASTPFSNNFSRNSGRF